MRRRRRPSNPTLAVAGPGAICALHAMAARLAGFDVVVAPDDDRFGEQLAAELRARRCELDALPAGADVVVVATEPGDRLDLVARTVSAGARTLVPGPLTSTLANADALVSMADEVPGAVHYGESLLHAPAVRAALEAVSRLGPLTHLEARVMGPRPPSDPPPPASRGGGALFELGPHAVALVLASAGADPVVSASGELRTDPGGQVDSHGVAALALASGATARVEASWQVTEPIWDLQAASGRGVVRLGLFPRPQLEVDGEPVAVPGAPSGADPHLHELGYVDQLASLRPVAGGPDQDPMVEPRLGRAVLEIVCAAHRSARAGSAPERLPYAGPRQRTPHQIWTD